MVQTPVWINNVEIQDESRGFAYIIRSLISEVAITDLFVCQLFSEVDWFCYAEMIAIVRNELIILKSTT